METAIIIQELQFALYDLKEQKTITKEAINAIQNSIDELEKHIMTGPEVIIPW